MGLVVFENFRDPDPDEARRAKTRSLLNVSWGERIGAPPGVEGSVLDHLTPPKGRHNYVCNIQRSHGFEGQ